MGVARRVAAAIVVLLSLWELVAWGFWGGLALVLSASSLRQAAVGVALLLLAALNPTSALAFFTRGGIFTWSLMIAVQVADVLAAALFFAGGPPNWSVLAAPAVTLLLLVVTFPGRAPA